MLGFVLGTVCLVGLVTMARHSCADHCHGCCSGSYGGCGHGSRDCGPRHGFGRGRRMFRRVMLRRVMERLDTTPGQEKVITAAADELRAVGRAAWDKLRASSDSIAQAVRGEAFDDSAMGAAFATQDEAITDARRALSSALGKVHEALDARQRAALADMLARGPSGLGTFGSPYRG